MTNLSGTNLNNGAAVGPQGECRESPSRFPRYPAYKDSGVEWMGEVPAHWNVAPVGMYYEIRNGFPFSADNFSPEGAPEHRLIRIRDILGNDSPLYTDESCPVQCIVENGDILIGMDGDFNIASWAEGKAKLNQRVCAIRGSSFSWDRFFFYGIGAPLKIINDLTFATTVKHLASSQVLKTRFPIPPETEVDNIARFLEHETARIDALIEEQQRLIELLKEKRQAVISHAVTKGLDPTVPMKDSGVEWLGEVPEHWEITQIKRRCDLITDGAHISPETENGVYCFVSTRDVSDEGIDFEGCLRTSADSYEYLVRTGCQPEVGDVLFSKDGTIGRTIVVGEGSPEFVVASSLIIIRPSREELLPSYLDFLCQSWVVSQQVDGFVKGAGLPRLSIQNLTKVVGVFPPLEEQVLIADFLQMQSVTARQLTSEALRTMELLKERRSALISAAVTGKIDVRGWQPSTSVQVPILEEAV